MPCFGGCTPFPKRLGGGKPRARVILESLNKGRGSGVDTTQTSTIYLDNLVSARAIAAAWGTNQRLANIWDSKRLVGAAIARWETIRAVRPNAGDSDVTRRARLVAIEALFGISPTHAQLVTMLSTALGNVFVALEYLSVANAQINVPDGTYPFGTPNAASPWSSTVAHLLIRVQSPTGMSEGAFLAAVALIGPMLDPVVPAWVTFDWYRPGPVSTAVAGGPSAAGFYLDDAHNLQNEVFRA